MFSETPVQLQHMGKLGLHMYRHIWGIYTDTVHPQIDCLIVMTLHLYNVLQITNIAHPQVSDVEKHTHSCKSNTKSLIIQENSLNKYFSPSYYLVHFFLRKVL